MTALQAPGVRYVGGGWQRFVDELSVGLEIASASVIATGEGEVHSSAGRHRAKKGVVIAVGTPSATASLLGGRAAADRPLPEHAGASASGRPGEPAMFNGEPGALLWNGPRLEFAAVFHAWTSVDGEPSVEQIFLLRNPDELVGLARERAPSGA